MRNQLSVVQCAFMIVMTVMPTAYLIVPSSVIGIASQDTWISLLLATAVGGGIAAWLGSFAAGNRSGEPFLDWLSRKTGRTFAFVAGILLFVHYFTNTSMALNEFIGFVTADMMPNTPNIVLIAVTVSIAMYAVAQGVEAIGRMSFLVMAVTFPLSFLTVVLLYSKMHLANLLPAGEMGIGRIAAGAYTPASWMTEASIILVLAPFMAKPRRAVRAAVWGTLIVAFELLFGIVQVLLLFGPHVSHALQYPIFELIAIIEYGGFLERVDMFFVMLWMTTVFLKISLLLFGAMHCLERTLRLRGGAKPILYAVGLLLTLDASYSWRRNFEMQLEALSKTVSLVAYNVLLIFVLWLATRRPDREGNRVEEGPA